MKLNELIQDIGAVETRGRLDIDITVITSDSRAVTPGSLFIAVKGFASDGHQYIGQALEKGAAAIVYETEGTEGTISSASLRDPIRANAPETVPSVPAVS